jgi:hypothetical protein
LGDGVITGFAATGGAGSITGTGDGTNKISTTFGGIGGATWDSGCDHHNQALACNTTDTVANSRQSRAEIVAKGFSTTRNFCVISMRSFQDDDAPRSR